MMVANDVRPSASRVAWSLGCGQFELGSEARTQIGVETFMTECGWRFLREHRLSAGDIPDFFLPGPGIVVEVKLKHNRAAAILRQLERYAVHDDVKALILLTNRAMVLPHAINGKPTFLVSLGRAWL